MESGRTHSSTTTVILLVLYIGQQFTPITSTPVTSLTANQQVSELLTAGYDVSKLDHHTQLKVFLYVWLSMERAENG